MTEKQKLDAAIEYIKKDFQGVVLKYDDAMELIIEAAKAHAASMNENTKKTTWIGEHVQRGFIAFGSELYSPKFFEIKEKPPATEKDDTK